VEDDALVKVFLVIEDEPDMRTLIALVLARDPRLELVGEAASANEALAVLDSVEPGLIILDHSIEGDIMGLDAAPLLKAKAPNAKILLFTAYDMSREAAAEPAVDSYLRKDRIVELLPTVQSMLGLAET
jgi:two-component system, NarL family, nitrate/nitrite response regulator NarL